MAKDLQTTIHSLAERFAADLMAALRGASLAEILEGTSGGAKLRAAARPAPAARAHTAPTSAPPAKGDITGAIVITLKKNGPMRSEDLRKALGVARPKMLYAIGKLAAAGAITKKGQKRATTYSAR